MLWRNSIGFCLPATAFASPAVSARLGREREWLCCTWKNVVNARPPHTMWPQCQTWAMSIPRLSTFHLLWLWERLIIWHYRFRILASARRSLVDLPEHCVFTPPKIKRPVRSSVNGVRLRTCFCDAAGRFRTLPATALTWTLRSAAKGRLASIINQKHTTEVIRLRMRQHSNNFPYS